MIALSGDEKVDLFDLKGKVIIVTGGAGFLGKQHCEAIMNYGGNPVSFDIKDGDYKVDILDSNSITKAKNKVLKEYGKIDGLINNAANNPKLGARESRLEHFSIEQWENDLGVGLTGAFLCSQIIGKEMVRRGEGTIINIASDLGVIAPDQRIYKKSNTLEADQPVKPVSYSVVKHGIIGLTKYLATYWASCGVRVNSISFGGMYNEQPIDFVNKLTKLIPMERMATKDEYKGAIVFLCSDASSYMTGANLIIDGGRTCW